MTKRNDASKNRLSWALVVATYRRHEILDGCLRLAACQTRPPREIIVVDASPDFETATPELVSTFTTLFPQIPLHYERATRASLPAQRNQGIELCTSDVVFLIDDDSYMYPDCAEEIMGVYERDEEAKIVGVSAIGVPTPPPLPGTESTDDTSPAGSGPKPAASPKQTRLRRAVKKLLRTESTYFIPYDAEFPHHDLPAELATPDVGVIQVMVGYAMTFRRAAFEHERFSEILERYAAGEDQDLSYRQSRHGLLLNALHAKLCHLEVRGGRLSPFIVATLANLNPVVLHRLYSTDLALSRRRLLRGLVHRLVVSVVKEIADGAFSLQKTRGIGYAMLWFSTIWRQDLESLGRWYPSFQADLVSRRRPLSMPSWFPSRLLSSE